MRTEQADAGSRQLDRQRQAVEPLAEVLDDGAVLRPHGSEVRGKRRRPFDEQLCRVVGVERRHGPQRFSTDGQPLAARREHREPRTAT